MSFKKKLAIFALVVILVVSLSVGVAFGLDSDASSGDGGENAEGFYTVRASNGATMTVNRENLSLAIEKDGRVWYSGKLSDEDTPTYDGEGDQVSGLTPLLAAQITDAVTVTYRALSNGQQTSRGFTSLANSRVTFRERDNGFDATVKIGGTVGIEFKLQVRFDGEQVTATIPADSIEESATDRTLLAQLSLYPYFDSSYMLAEGGQIFVPDGSGAVIDLSQQNNAISPYSGRVYGDDYGFASTNSIRANAAERVTMPVIAALYPDGGTMAVATKGAAYARVNAAVSGMTNNYNRTYFSFIYREEYNRTYEGAIGNTGVTFPKEINEFDAQVTYKLLPENSDVVDVATAYRDEFLSVKKNTVDTVGLRLKFLMSENKQGMFGREVVNMTDTDFVLKVAQEVTSYCNGLNVSLTGFQQGGLGGANPSVFPLDGKSGGNKGYQQLAAELAKIYVQMTFVNDYVRAHDRAGVSRYNLAQNVSEQFIVMNDLRAGSTATFSLMKPSYTESLISKDVKKLEKYSNAGIEFETLGSLLFTGFKQEVFTRNELMDRQVKAVKDAGVFSAISNPNDYMYGVMSSCVDVPLESSSFLIETESVPFVQMVLSGYAPMYSRALNLDYTGQQLILRLIDSNVYPSFILTDKDAIELYGTDSQEIFTSSFDIWKYSVKETYEQVNAVLKEVVGCTVVSRVRVQPNVYVTTYSNGVRVVVNYSGAMVDVDGRQIAPQSAVAVK